MTTYLLTYEVVVEANSEEEACDEAVMLISSLDFEPSGIEILEDA